MISSVLSSAAQALVFPITTWTKPVKNAQYQQWLNQAPPAYVWQNDPGTLAAYGRIANRTTGFCEPAAIGTAFYNQKIYRKVAPDLKVVGVDLDAKTIDSNQTLSDLVKRCKSDAKRGTYIHDAFRCISDIYTESGYTHSQIKFIANDDFAYGTDFTMDGETISGIPYYTLERRKPTIQDIIDGLNAGYEVIAVAKRISNGRVVGGHWFNVSGYGIKSSGTDLFATDPTAYGKYGGDEATTFNGQHPLFYPIAAMMMTSDANIVPDNLAPVRFSGLMIEKLTPDVVMGHLLLLKAQR